MARGWESKSVESQIETAESKRAESQRRAALSTERIELQKERESLELSRTRVLRDLETAKNAPYRKQLEAALLHLDEKLALLK